MYLKGMGTAPEEEEAFSWYELAARLGIVRAQAACGGLCHKGIETAADKAKALYWYERAAEQGLAGAQK